MTIEDTIKFPEVMMTLTKSITTYKDTSIMTGLCSVEPVHETVYVNY